MLQAIIAVGLLFGIPTYSCAGDAALGEFIKVPELFDYNQPRIEEYHTPRLSKKDKSLIAIFELLNAADWTQTRQIARQPEQFSEAGSARMFLGKKPSKGRVNSLFAIEALGYPWLVNEIDGWNVNAGDREALKNLLHAFSILGKGKAVSNNLGLGLDIFRW